MTLHINNVNTPAIYRRKYLPKTCIYLTGGTCAFFVRKYVPICYQILEGIKEKICCYLRVKFRDAELISFFLVIKILLSLIINMQVKIVITKLVN